MHNMSEVGRYTIIHYARVNARLNVSQRRVFWTQNCIRYFFPRKWANEILYNIIVNIYNITSAVKQSRARMKNSSLGEYNYLFINYKVVRRVRHVLLSAQVVSICPSSRSRMCGSRVLPCCLLAFHLFVFFSVFYVYAFKLTL